MREWITGSSFMERFGGQRAGPPNSYRRGFAAVSRFLSPLQSRCTCVRSTLAEPTDVRALALDPAFDLVSALVRLFRDRLVTGVRVPIHPLSN